MLATISLPPSNATAVRTMLLLPNPCQRRVYLPCTWLILPCLTNVYKYTAIPFLFFRSNLVKYVLSSSLFVLLRVFISGSLTGSHLTSGFYGNLAQDQSKPIYSIRTGSFCSEFNV